MSDPYDIPRNPHFIEVTKQFLMAMPIAQHLGFEITDVAVGRFEITQPFRRELSFREGTFQAGPVGTLADMAAACAGATMLVARGRVLRSGRTLSVAAADVFSVLNGEETLCATALATIRNYELPESSAPIDTECGLSIRRC
jgi:acyl-coenzyme A thioesterase PaaI-like protein